MYQLRTMSAKKTFKFQRTSSTTAEHCCVLLCQASSKYNSVLSFHTFHRLRKLGENGLSLYGGTPSKLLLIPAYVVNSTFCLNSCVGVIVIIHCDCSVVLVQQQISLQYCVCVCVCVLG